MRDGEARREQPDPVEMIDQSAGIGVVRPFALVARLEEMRVNTTAGRRGALGDRLERLVADPLRPDRAILHDEPRMLEGGDRIDSIKHFGGGPPGLATRRDDRALGLWQAREQRREVAIHKGIAVGDRHGKGDADADVLRGTRHRLRLFHEPPRILGVVAMIGGGDAAFRHAREGDGSAIVRIDLWFLPKGADPHLEHVIERTERKSAQPAPVIMRVDRRGQGDKPARSPVDRADLFDRSDAVACDDDGGGAGRRETAGLRGEPPDDDAAGASFERDRRQLTSRERPRSASA